MKFFMTVYILWLRQIKRYSRSRSRIIGSLAQPLLFLLAFGYGFGPVYKRAGAGDYLQFLTPGIIGMSIIFSAVFSGMEVIWDRQFGFLKETLVAPVSRLSIMIGRTLGGATIATIQGLLVFGIAIIGGFRPVDWATAFLAVPVMALVALLFTALGTAAASYLEDMQGFQMIMNFLVMPLFFLSGALFPLNDLPRPIALVAMWDPLSYGIDALRGLLVNSTHFGLGLDLVVLSAVTAFILVLGSYFFTKIEV
jgi:ABC-2 type transport system permease protein